MINPLGYPQRGGKIKNQYTGIYSTIDAYLDIIRKEKLVYRYAAAAGARATRASAGRTRASISVAPQAAAVLQVLAGGGHTRTMRAAAAAMDDGP
jgi:hypothetical protein